MIASSALSQPIRSLTRKTLGTEKQHPVSVSFSPHFEGSSARAHFPNSWGSRFTFFARSPAVSFAGSERFQSLRASSSIVPFLRQANPSTSHSFTPLFPTNPYKLTPPSSSIGSLLGHLPVTGS